MPTRTAPSSVQSLTLPAVIHNDSGRPRPSQAMWIFVVNPPRERPIARSGGSTVGNV